MPELKLSIVYAIFTIALNLAQVSTFTFNRSLIEVLFSPYVAPNDLDDTYKEFDMQVMIKQIATRFTKVAANVILPRHFADSLELVPVAIALFNKEQTSAPPSLELSMAFARHHLQYYGTTSLDFVITCAEDANRMFPGTVKSIMLQYCDVSVENLSVDGVLEELAIAKRSLLKIPNKYTLGIMLHVSYCETMDLTRHRLIPILVEVGFVQFENWPTQEDFDQGVEKSVKNFTSIFDTCLQNVKEINTRVKIEFRTRWPDSSSDGTQDLSALVYFWEEVATWANKRNTTVIFHEAFDAPRNRLYNESTNGWWRLSPSYKFINAKEYIFQEKKSLITPKIVNPASPYGTFSNHRPADVLSADTRHVVIGIGVGGGVLILVLSTLIIYLYKKNIQHAQLIFRLTKVELEQFFHGMSTQGRTDDGNSSGHPLDSLNALPYNKDYEVERSDFHIDMGNKLGSGQFGLILLGTLNNVEIAVKTINPNTPSLFTLKGMMSEIKVLSHLGEHKNIVTMLGSCTSELKQGNVYLLLELCINGSLDKRLKLFHEQEVSQYDNVVRYFKDPSTGYLNPTGHVGNTQQFLRWSMEILAGMEFLALKHVVHADLATRNVLLTADLTCKVSDFGLSRRLYNYTNYVKAKEEPMPWRWMAPEALRRLEFNEKTDVWAYGVTIWEIFSFGDVPYPGYTWDGEFLTRLENGLRLDEPSQKCNGVYDIMKQCWIFDPVVRLTFAELKIKFDVLI